MSTPTSRKRTSRLSISSPPKPAARRISRPVDRIDMPPLLNSLRGAARSRRGRRRQDPDQASPAASPPGGLAQVGGIVYRQPVCPRQPENFGLHRNAIHPDRDASKVSKKTRRAGLGDSFPALVDHQDVANLKPPQTGHDGFFGPHSP